jgi:large subunit ribosomal protein L15
MDLTQYKPDKSPRKKSRRIGRGEGSGWGKTAGRGHKGQKSRAGGGPAVGFEGGQMALARRIPKWGFTNIFKKEYVICNVSDLNVFKDGDLVDRESLTRKGTIGRSSAALKILGDGELKVKLTVKAHKFSRSAAEKIQALGGQIEVIK